jgi:D-alanyl-D-alanine-carboxypeptidase/D-alanyl-D-alanine-endopeptidase
VISRRGAVAAGAASAAWWLTMPAARSQVPTDMAALLDRRVADKGAALAAAQVGRDGIVYSFAGRVADADASLPPDEHTLFEIGSISKTFTAVLLADAVVRGEVALDDPVERFLPGGVKLRDRDGAPLRLLDLATHRSGLPRSPGLPSWIYRLEPFGSYGATDLMAWLARWKPEVPRGERYTYSNVGIGLLGWLLGRRAGSGYAALLKERVLQPLGIADAVHVAVPAGATATLAAGHDEAGAPAPAIDFGVLAPAGSLVASAAAIARYAQAALGLLDDRPLEAAFLLAMRPHAEGPAKGSQVGLAWLVVPLFDRLVYRHEGDTPGFSSALVLHPARRRGALVLASRRQPALAELALYAIDARVPLR